MKLQISFDIPDLDKALAIATEVAPYATILEIGSILLYKYGIKAVEQFRAQFPDKTLLVDAKIADRAKEAVTLLVNAGADWVTVIAGTGKNVIHAASATAHALNAKIMLDLIDTNALGQFALEAANLEVDALLLHKPHDEQDPLLFLDQWDIVRGNTTLPIFVSGKINRDVLDKILEIKPEGIIIGTSITNAENPLEEIQYYFKKIHPSDQ